jgi:hypothetical protein
MTTDTDLEYVYDDFFQGRTFWEREDIGHFWVAKHGEKELILSNCKAKPKWLPETVAEVCGVRYIPEFETLTIEPKSGGQYEIAVRVWLSDKGLWAGYKTDFITYQEPGTILWGVNTNGH